MIFIMSLHFILALQLFKIYFLTNH